jgi:hypothetical protein
VLSKGHIQNRRSEYPHLPIMPYSQDIIDKIGETPKSLGNQLGRWAIYHDFSVVRIAKALGVTRQTVYNWFLGKDIFPAYRDRAEWMLKILQSSHNAEDAWRKVCKDLNLEP